jgi:hypothetical protein
MVNTTDTMKTTSGHTGQHCLRKGNKMNNISAFPMTWVKQEAPNLNVILEQRGMTMRDYFAAKVMQAMLGSNWVLKDEEIPARAYKLADMMMKASKE